MNSTFLLRSIILAMSLSATAAFAHSDTHMAKKIFDAGKVEETAFGREGDPQKVTRTIRVTMSDRMRFSPSTLVIKPGETIRLVVNNRGKMLHEMVIGTREELQKHAELMRKFPGMEHDAAHMAHVKPGKSGDIVWQFDKAGEYSFACLIAGHFEAGMTGKVVVK